MQETLPINQGIVNTYLNTAMQKQYTKWENILKKGGLKRLYEKRCKRKCLIQIIPKFLKYFHGEGEGLKKKGYNYLIS